MLVIEDLQWMGSLREIIADLLKNACLPQPLVAIGTARPEFAATDEELAQLTGIDESGLSANGQSCTLAVPLRLLTQTSWLPCPDTFSIAPSATRN